MSTQKPFILLGNQRLFSDNSVVKQITLIKMILNKMKMLLNQRLI